jgi:type IV pilus assembly protein PilC
MATATKTFLYEAIGTDGTREKGRLEAPNEQAAVAALRQQGATPLSMSQTGTGLNRELRIPGLGNRVKLKELSVFMRQFATMSASGLTLLRSLSILEDQTPNATLKATIGEVRADIEAGRSLSASMAKHEKVFPALTIALIRAGETGGFLDDALARIATNLEKDVALRAKIKSAMTYPVIVLAFAGLMVTGVLMFIVPIFEKMFKQLGGDLPLPTKIIVNTSHSLALVIPIFLAVAVSATVLVRHRLRTKPAFRLWFDQRKLKLPVFGKLFAKMSISRFSRNLGTLLGVGVPVMQALDVVAATTGNAVVSQAMLSVADSVRSGQSMSAPLAEHDVFPPMVAQMVEVGEESGQISAMLDRIADFYDREVDAAAEALTASIEPIMVVLMGGIVGGMVVCLYLPMFSIYQHIQGAS